MKHIFLRGKDVAEQLEQNEIELTEAEMATISGALQPGLNQPGQSGQPGQFDQLSLYYQLDRAYDNQDFGTRSDRVALLSFSRSSVAGRSLELLKALPVLGG
ncbi:MAG: hypothetical protein IMW89_03435 [Ktedonobacteraceae bacterium]|nr:hypothetical protein [Ktedonobacteraceae bacterium]